MDFYAFLEENDEERTEDEKNSQNKKRWWDFLCKLLR
jgi:hypothetical protein